MRVRWILDTLYCSCTTRGTLTFHGRYDLCVNQSRVRVDLMSYGVDVGFVGCVSRHNAKPTAVKCQSSVHSDTRDGPARQAEVRGRDFHTAFYGVYMLYTVRLRTRLSV